MLVMLRAVLLAAFAVAQTSALPVLDSVTVPQPALDTQEFDFGYTLKWDTTSIADNLTPETLLYCRVFRNEQVIAQDSTAALDEDGFPIAEGSCPGVKVTGKGYSTLILELSYTEDFAAIVSEETRVRVIAGWITVLPPILTVVLAIWTRDVLVSLFSGIWLAAFFIHWFDPFRGFLRAIDTYTLNAFADVDHIYIILFSWFLSGITGLMQRAGGAQGIANAIVAFAKTRRTTMVVCFLCGLAIFFDDYSNTLIVGATFRSVFDSMLISREKLAFLVDATSAPVASISPISSWIGFELSLIDESYTSITEGGYDMEANGYETSPFIVFVRTIPGRYYPIAMLCLQLFLIILQRDFGPMLRAERRAINEGKVTADDANQGQTAINPALEKKEGLPARWYNAVAPIALIIVLVIISLVCTGLDGVEAEGLSKSVENIFGNSDAYSALLWSTFFTTIVTIVFLRLQYYDSGEDKIMWPWSKTSTSRPLMRIPEGVEAWIKGIEQLVATTLVLILAWGIGDAMTALGTDVFIASAVSDSLDPRALPVLVFILSAAISTATGTSWGTMAIMFPIATKSIVAAAPGDEQLMFDVIASILSGSVFGDHITPISDTTILSSLSCRCDLMHHVKTQAPYAFFVAINSIIWGDLLSGYAYPSWVGLLLTIFFTILGGFFITVPVFGTRSDPISALFKRLPPLPRFGRGRKGKGSMSDGTSTDNDLALHEASVGKGMPRETSTQLMGGMSGQMMQTETSGLYPQASLTPLKESQGPTDNHLV